MSYAQETYEQYFPEEEAAAADENTPKKSEINQPQEESASTKVEIPVAENVNENTEEGNVNEEDDAFSAEFLTILLETSLDEDVKTVNATKFLNACNQIPKLFEGLGSALKQGNSALVDKINIIRQRQKETAEELNVEMNELSLQDIIERDIKHKYTHTGKKARHATRNIIRLVWFLDFLTELFVKLAENPEMSLKEVCQHCWKTTLGPRQKRLVNMTTTQLMKVAPFPKKDEFLAYLSLADLSKDERNKSLQIWADRTDMVSKEMWAWLKTKKLEQVP